MLRIRASALYRRKRNRIKEHWVIYSTWTEVYAAIYWRRIREHNFGPLVEALTICILLLGIIYSIAALLHASNMQYRAEQAALHAMKQQKVSEHALLRCLNSGGIVATTETELYYCYTKVIPFKRI